MKVSILTLTLLALLVSCGKSNESGKSGLPTTGISPYTTNEETLIRQDFLKKGAELLRIYESQMKSVIGPRTVGLIRNKLKYDNILVTHQYLYDGGHRYTRSVHRDDSVTLYIGRDQAELDWGQVRLGTQYNRLVMHELLEMGNVDDYHLVVTDRILSRRN